MVYFLISFTAINLFNITTIMRKITLLVALIMGVTIITIGQPDYKMLQLVYLKPIPGADLEAASKAIAEHNKKFHAVAPFKASVWTTLTGDMNGTWTWVMYPATFTDYDSRPSGEDHESDWRKATKPYFELVTNEYWKEEDKLSYAPEGMKQAGKVLFTVFDIRPGQTYRFKAILEDVSEVYKQKKYTYDFTIYWNQFNNKQGRDVAIEVMFDKFAFIDEDHSLKKDFEEVHGEGSWWKLMAEYEDIVVSSDDELSVLMPEMSAE